MQGSPGEQTPGGDATATTGGGASEDRGGRDSGMPGPDRDAMANVAGGSKRHAASSESDAIGTGAAGAPPSHGADDEAGGSPIDPAATSGGPSDGGSNPLPTT